MPDVSRTEIGRRIFSLQKEKNVERAIEKIRQHLGPEWGFFSQDDLKVLKYIIGETWVFSERDLWEKISFSSITRIELMDIISIGRKSLEKEMNERNAVENVAAILFPATEKRSSTGS